MYTKTFSYPKENKAYYINVDSDKNGSSAFFQNKKYTADY